MRAIGMSFVSTPQTYECLVKMKLFVFDAIQFNDCAMTLPMAFSHCSGEEAWALALKLVEGS